jgi:hypothetical protein
MQRLYKSLCRSLVSGVASVGENAIPVPVEENVLLFDNGVEALLDSGENIIVRTK